MTDFTKILDKAKELEAKMKESQEKIKSIRAEGVSGSDSVKITLDGEGEMQSIEISDQMFKEQKSIVEDLIVAAHNDAKTKLKSKTKEEITKATGGLGIPGFKWPL
ncbi:YbaB/EbfC family nucleoid-associated protein [Candidatus Pelagibacter sp.]|nr:YbaB/EbfC family nucleoid-associated protein [Candidatus Pelagibacter sp.]